MVSKYFQIANVRFRAAALLRVPGDLPTSLKDLRVGWELLWMLLVRTCARWCDMLQAGDQPLPGSGVSMVYAVVRGSHWYAKVPRVRRV